MSPALLAWLATLLASTLAHGTWGTAYAAAQPAASRAPIVFLHGMRATPERVCPLLASTATRFGLFVCPRGNAFDAGEASWIGTARDASHAISLALRASAPLVPHELPPDSGATLIGYSSGAYFAAEVACSEPGRWSGLVLLSMKLDLDPARLRSAGVRRVVLAAGEHDDSWKAMRALAGRVADAEVQARFVSLGPAGHPLPADVGARLCEAIAWVRGVEPEPCTDPP